MGEVREKQRRGRYEWRNHRPKNTSILGKGFKKRVRGLASSALSPRSGNKPNVYKSGRLREGPNAVQMTRVSGRMWTSYRGDEKSGGGVGGVMGWEIR